MNMCQKLLLSLLILQGPAGLQADHTKTTFFQRHKGKIVFGATLTSLAVGIALALRYNSAAKDAYIRMLRKI